MARPALKASYARVRRYLPDEEMEITQIQRSMRPVRRPVVIRRVEAIDVRVEV
jgi:hypothetical protein